MPFDTTPAFALPEDAGAGDAGRPASSGPTSTVPRRLAAGRRGDRHHRRVVTMRDLCEARGSGAGRRDGADGEIIGSLRRYSRQHAARDARRTKPWLISPIDLQAVKAAGVTFVVSMLERVIEEQARGLPERANAIRSEIQTTIGDDLARLRPGSEQAMALKQLLIEKGMWSQYLEVGIGPDAEIFSKAQPMSTRRPSRRDRHPSDLDLEQSRAGSRAGRLVKPATSSARRSATTSICAMSRAARRCCCPRPRTTMPAPRSAR